ncbi:MAG: DUF1858 domain-containing protein, partial [Synergistales bacterium]|nr:DUF1858 domain-containing protein [Synergistales bacterium]
MSTGDREQRSRFWTSQRVLRRDMTVRQVAHDFPATRAVFIAYGEPPERTPFGHLEPLESFAARHGVPVERLLADLSEAAGVPADTRPPTADWVHRPFVAAALFVTLTIGAGWGAWLLWEIGRGGSFSSAPVAHVVAHGEAQLWGFLSLFVAGIALRWIPMATGSRSVPVWQWSAIWLLLVGGVTGGYVWALWPSAVPWLGVSSGAALAAATVLILFFFLSRLGKRLSEPWVWAVLAAGV